MCSGVMACKMTEGPSQKIQKVKKNIESLSLSNSNYNPQESKHGPYFN